MQISDKHAEVAMNQPLINFTLLQKKKKTCIINARQRFAQRTVQSKHEATIVNQIIIYKKRTL